MFRPLLGISILFGLMSSPLSLAQANPTGAKTQTTASQPSASANLIPPDPAYAARLATRSAAVPGDKAVLTVHGVCETAQPTSQTGSACLTVVTKQQMEAVIDVVQATGKTILAPQKRDVAIGYVDLLTGATAAEKAGIDKDPRFAEVLRLARMKALSDLYRVRLQEEARNISANDIATYYQQNLAGFEELHLQLLSLPRYNAANLGDADYQARAKKLAYEVQQRASRGEGMEALEQEISAALNVKKPPSVHLAPVRRGVYAKEQEEMLFTLKSGDVSRVIEQPSVFLIFKLEERKTPTLTDVKDEIQKKLSQNKLEQLTASAAGTISVDYNEDYFGPPQGPSRPMIEVPLARQKPEPGR
jgi:hypothetical protein